MNYVHQIRAFGCSDKVVEKVAFPHSAPPYARKLEEHLGCEALYDAPALTVAYRRDPLESPLRSQILGEFDLALEQQLEELKVIRRRGHSSRVQDLLDEHLERSDVAATKPTLEWAASRLGGSARTLRRRLEHEGTSFQAVLDDVRYYACCDLLWNSTLSLSQVAIAAGFSEASALCAFLKRNDHPSPSALRKALNEFAATR